MPSVAQVAVCMLVAASEGFDRAAMGLAGPGMIKGLGLSRSAFGLAATKALFGDRRAPVTALLWVANFFTAFMYYMVANWAPTLLSERGLPPVTLGAANAAMAIGAMIGALGLTTLLDRRCRRLPFLLAYGAMILAFAAFHGRCAGRGDR